MNKIINLITLCLIITLSSTFNSALLAQEEKASQEIISTAKMSMNIDGMTCAMGCARAIEVELNNIDGVEQARVDFDSKSAVLSYNAELTSEAYLVDFVNTYRKGAFSASLVGGTKEVKKSCCSGKKESCSPEQKAKCADNDRASSSSISSETASSEKLSSKKCTKSCCAKK
jgi:copper chaperone CopZ